MTKDFKREKARAKEVSKEDWDKKMIPLCDAINSHPDYFTTSSCAGRMVLLKIPMPGTKDEAEWIFTTHEQFSHDKIMQALKKAPEEQVVYRYEPFILHVRCKDLASAKRLLDLVRGMGLRKCGIVDLDNITLEIIGTAEISTLISSQKEILLPEDYIKIMVETSNMLLEGNWNILEMITRLVKNKL